MKKLKYILKKLRTLRYKEFYNRANEIGHKVNKSTCFILFDMAKCAVKYGSGYMDYFEFEFYLLNSEERATYVTGRINSDIVMKYNKKEDCNRFNDKVEFNNLFKEFLGRDFLDLRSASFKDFKDFIKGKDKIVVKPLDLCGGKGVEVVEIDSSKLKNEYNILKIYNSIMKKEQFLIEDYIEQHNTLSKLYDGSVNSLRVVSFLDDNGDVQILNVVLKIGNGGSVDNFSSGGMYTFVDDKGKVFVPAIDENGNIFEKHPVSGVKINDFVIPYYDKIKPFVGKLAKVVPTVRYVGWDIVITKTGVVVIEGNQFPGIFQVKPSISGIKIGDLPKYKEYMDI